MAARDSQHLLRNGEGLQFLDLASTTLMARSLEELASSALPLLTRIMDVPAALLYLEAPNLLSHFFSQTGLQPEVVSSLEKVCAAQFSEPPTGMECVSFSLSSEKVINLSLFRLQTQRKAKAILGFTRPGDETLLNSVLLGKVLSLLSHALNNLLDRADVEKRNRYLNAYMTVSSMIAQPLTLSELLETTLYCCMEVVAAEAASILLLDYEKASFQFFVVQGPAKPLLEAATFPADKGIAGSVLKTRRSEIINHVQTDPRFFGKFDCESGFHTRNMIAIPLMAKNELIGVLEVINKAGGELFNEEEHLLLRSIATEIAFSIRNARIFEYVADSYCRQRQGYSSCEECKRPLGSWTPCERYRQAGLSG